MKKMKKILAVVCVLTMVFAMTACGNTNDEEGKRHLQLQKVQIVVKIIMQLLKIQLQIRKNSLHPAQMKH